LKFLKIAELVENVKYPPLFYFRSSTALTLKWRLVEDPVVSEAEVKKHVPQLRLDKITQYPDEYLLFFWSSCATFEVVYDADSEVKDGIDAPEPWQKRLGASANRPQIRDTRGNCVGSTCGIFAQDREAGGYVDGNYNFIVIGRRQFCILNLNWSFYRSSFVMVLLSEKMLVKYLKRPGYKRSTSGN